MSEKTSIGATTLAAGLRAMPSGDRLLLKAITTCAVIALAGGVVFGALTALVRAGVVVVFPETGYRLMTAHGVTVFFYWLYFAQSALLLAFSAVHTRRDPGIAAAPLAWTSLLLMVGGLVAGLAGTWWGAPLLYDGSPEIVGEERFWAGIFYLGYLALGAGLFLVAAAAIATALRGKAESETSTWTTVGFGCVAWAGLVMVSAVAAVNAFAPAALWAFGLADPPQDHATGWDLLFHNLHYLPLMGTVLAWYVLIKETTGVGSMFGERFSKIVFACYLVFVPPTSLYHMFLEPGLAPLVRAVGSFLSLFISVPTIAVFLVIVGSLEANARARGARGLFGWVRLLPWRDPAIAAIGMAVVNLAIGGALAFVLIQERLAGLLSDTFFVPGYFHFLTVGTVTLTLLAAFTRMIPAMTGHPLRAPRLLTALPYVLTLGLAVFGLAGIVAGMLGMPRRVLDAAYDQAAPAAWTTLSGAIGIGAAVMGAALLLYACVLLYSLVAPKLAPVPADTGTSVFAVPDGAAIRQAAWTGPLSVLVLVGAMYALTTLAFVLMRSLPLIATGGGGH